MQEELAAQFSESSSGGACVIGRRNSEEGSEASSSGDDQTLGASLPLTLIVAPSMLARSWITLLSLSGVGGGLPCRVPIQSSSFKILLSVYLWLVPVRAVAAREFLFLKYGVHCVSEALLGACYFLSLSHVKFSLSPRKPPVKFRR